MQPLDGESFLTLPWLSLRKPNRSVKQVYSSVLASKSWPTGLSLLSTLGDADEVGAGHRVVRSHWGATGCVNALDWEDGGQGRLATAGDDTKISVWTPGIDSSTSGDDSTSPKLSYGLTEVLETGHTANIFSVAFAPSSPSTLFSCAGDGTARVYDLDLATNPSLSSSTIPAPGHPPWTHHESACTRILRCHTSRVKRIATESSPSTFLTCSEDGTVRQHDLRTTHTCRQPGQRGRASACGPPLVDYPGMSLYSLSVSKLKPHLFVVAGTSEYAYLHDRRMLRTPMVREWGIEPSSEVTQCVRRFGVPKSEGRGEITNHVVATKLSSAKANDLLVSYSDAGVFLFDTDGETYTRPEEPTSKAEDSVDVGNEGRPEKRQREESSPEIGPHLEDAADAADEEGLEEDPDEGSEEEEEKSDRFRRRFHADVPLIAPRRTYEGHRNDQTVKDVNFAFGNDAFVVSGSDDGNWFVWDKDTADLVGIYEGDNSVVNVIECHPRLPIVAVSGIDPTVKLFGPTIDPEQRATLVDKTEEIIARNRSDEGRRSRISAEAMIAMLMRRVPLEERARARVALEGQEGEAVECAVM